MNAYHFDTLPLHPQPETLESFTSYVMRLAEANGIGVRYQLKPLFFPDRSRGVIHELADFPMSSFGNLPALAACSEPRLLGTTFYYLAQRFNRPTLPQTTGQFLAGMLARRLRYCPRCLEAERPYYSLAWRFRTLSGCPRHGCRLLDRCPQCGYEVPFLTKVLKVGICPECGAALSAGVARPMKEDEHQQAQRHYQELALLLAIPPDDAPPIAPGPRLAYWRQAQGLTVEEVARRTGMTPRSVWALERYRLERGAKLQNYFDYVACLGLSFAELFETELATEPEPRPRFTSYDAYQTYEEQLLSTVQQAIKVLKAEGTLLTQQTVSRRVGMSVMGLLHYPRVKALLSQLKHERSQQLQVQRRWREQELVKQVRQAVTALQEQRAIVTQEAIGALIGLTPTGLRRYPPVRELLKEVARQKREASSQRMLVKVEMAIGKLRAARQPVTKVAVARLIGVTPSSLNYHPQVRLLLEQNGSHRLKPPPVDIEERLHVAVQTLQAQERRLTFKAICELAGVSWVSLRHYPQAEWIRELCRQDRRRHEDQHRVRVTARVQQAIGDLQKQNVPVSQRAVCQVSGLPSAIFNRFPELSEEVAVARKLSLQQRREHRQQVLLEQVEQAVAALIDQDVPFTRRDVYRQAGVPVTTARTYREVERLVQQSVKERRAKERQERRKKREQALVEQVEKAIEQLQMQERSVTQKAICHMVGMARPAMRKYPRVQAILARVVQERVSRSK
jgi:transcriptional regulator with XRE-family HTH domain